MATLADLSFKLYTDSGLTTAFSGLHQLTHQSDLSDNPQDFQLWFGSTDSANKLETETNPGTDNITLTPTETLDDWLASTAYVVGDTVEPTVQNGYRYVVQSITGGGVTDSSEPTWPTSGFGTTVTDNEVTWVLTAQTHETTEIKLATTSAGLDGATAGAALSLGTTINGGSGNAVEVNIRYTNAVTEISSNTGYPELSIDINSVNETAI